MEFEVSDLRRFALTNALELATNAIEARASARCPVSSPDRMAVWKFSHIEFQNRGAFNS